MFNVLDEAQDGKVVLCSIPNGDHYVIVKTGHDTCIRRKVRTAEESSFQLSSLLQWFDNKAFDIKQQGEREKTTLNEIKVEFSDAEVLRVKAPASSWVLSFIPFFLQREKNKNGTVYTIPQESDSKYAGYSFFIPKSLSVKKRSERKFGAPNGEQISLAGDCFKIPPDFLIELKSGETAQKITSSEFLSEIMKATKYVILNQSKFKKYENAKLYETNVPEQMRRIASWVGERLTYNSPKGKFDKMIIDPNTGYNARINIDTTFGSFDTAVAAVDLFDLDGIGFAFTDSTYESTGLFCLDIDRKKDGTFSETGKEIAKRLKGKTYMEYSAGGAIHIFGIARGLGEECHAIKDSTVELYKHRKAIMLTGKTIGESKISDITEEMADIYEKYFARPDLDSPKTIAQRNCADEMSEEEIIHMLRSGKQASKFEALMNGDLSAYGGDESSYNAADLALCGMIAFYTHNESVIDSIYRKSALYTAQKYYSSSGRIKSRAEKWDAPRTGGTYGEQTIRKAIAYQSNMYQKPQFIQLYAALRIFAESATSYMIKPSRDKKGMVWIPKKHCKIIEESKNNRMVIATTQYYFEKYNLQEITGLEQTSQPKGGRKQ